MHRIAGYFCKGLLIGLIFGVPAGAIGTLTVGRTLEKGLFCRFSDKDGFLGSRSGLLLCGCIWHNGGFGLLSARQNTLQVIGGILVLLFGFGILCKKESVIVQKGSKGTLASCFLSSFTTALVNPATVLSFMAAFAAFGIHGGLSAKQGAALNVGILAGTLCWWLVLSGITAHFRDRITGKIYRWLNCVLGCLMTGFGMVMVVQGIVR